MKKPLLYVGKRFLSFLSKPLLILSLLLFIYSSAISQTGSIVDGCLCLSNASCPNDGQFTSTLHISNGGSGPWFIVQDSIRGFYTYPSPAPPASPTAFATGPAGIQFTDLGSGDFELTGIHVDGKSFRVLVTDGSTTLVFTSAGCSYSHTAITGDPFVCRGATETYSTTLHAGSTYAWTLDGGGTISSDPTLNSITVQWSTSSSGAQHNLQVVETSQYDCTETVVLPVMIEQSITLACNNLVFISLDANCGGGLDADMFLEGTQYDNNSYSLIITAPDGSILNSNLLNSSMVGKTYMVTVLQNCTGNSCWSNMVVLDKTAPELLCHTDTVKCSTDIRPQFLDHGFPLVYYSSINTTSNPYVYIATGSNGCSNVTLKYYDTATEQPCSSRFTSIINRVWFATDASGNQTSCTDTIKIERTGLADIKYPGNWDGITGSNPSLNSCGTYAKDTHGNPAISVTGQPSGPNCGNLMVTYSDKRLYLCSPDTNSYKVLRHWVVMDMCTNQSHDTIQIIAVMDVSKPLVSFTGLSNDTLFVNSQNYTCGSDVTLPVPTITDCSKTTLKVKYQLADANGVFPGSAIPYNSVPLIGGKYIISSVPRGLARVKYIAEDACGNTTEKIIYIKVKDNLPPQAVCDEHTNVTLNEIGITHLGKITFDDGSYDNCTSVSFKVRRMTSPCNQDDLNWVDGIDFCCADVAASPILVELRVTDENGFSSSCMAKVYVNDQKAPTITCPTSGSVSCKFDYSNLSVFGTVRTTQSAVQKIYVNDPEHGGNQVYFGLDGYASDNCSVSVEELTPSKSINNCGSGTIIRYFRAKDSANNYSSTCSQTITITDFKKFTSNDIDWPDDYSYSGCLTDAVLPDNLPVANGWPKLIGEDQCSQLAMDYDDLVFEHIDGMCYKIMRKWRVIDWCQYNTNDPVNSPGYWEYTQKIIVNDSSLPTITSGCSPASIVSLGNCTYKVSFLAAANDNCTSANHLLYSYTLNKNNSTSDIVTGSGNHFDVNLSKGTHKITWKVEDACGNVGQCSQTFTVQDTKAPTPQCVEGLVTVLLPVSGEVTINAANFNRHSFDDCTLSNYGSCSCLTDLKFAFSSNVNNTTRKLTCADIANGIKDTIPLEMWVFDESGNKDFCNTFIILQDNSNVCPDVIVAHDTAFFAVSGTIYKPNNEPVRNVELNLKNDNTEFSKTTTSNTDGLFTFNHLPESTNFNLKPSKEGDDLNGVSTLDIVLIQKHLLNILEFNNTYQYIAADVNNSGTVTASDISELRKMILGINQSFNTNTSWRFFLKDLTQDQLTEYKNLTNDIAIGQLTGDLHKDIIAVKTGDINNSAVTVGTNGLKYRNKAKTVIATNNFQFAKDENISIDLKATEGMLFSGAQFTVQFDPALLKFNGLSNTNIGVNVDKMGLNQLDKGIITFSVDQATPLKIMNGERLFGIDFTAINSGSVINSFKINSVVTSAELYETKSNEIIENQLELRYDGLTDNTFKVYQNNPNPFSEKTSIGFELPQKAQASLTVYDVTGRQIYNSTRDFDKGYNEFELVNKDLHSSGVLYYKVESGNDSEMKKMVLIK